MLYIWVFSQKPLSNKIRGGSSSTMVRDCSSLGGSPCLGGENQGFPRAGGEAKEEKKEDPPTQETWTLSSGLS
jgi:hypothetical protein